MAAQGLASQVGVAPACRALGRGHGPPSTVVTRPLPGTSSPVQRPPGRCASPNASMCSTCSPPLASSTARPPRSSPHCSMKANTCARSARCIGSWPRINRCESGAISSNILATPSPSWWPPGERDVVLGHHSTARTDTLELLLPLHLARHLQPLRGRLDGRRARERRPRRNADRADLPQARHRAPGPHPALRPRGAHDQQMHRATARRPRGDSLAEPPPRQR